MLDRKTLTDRLRKLREDEENAAAQLYALRGAVQNTEWCLQQLEESNVKPLKEAVK